MNEGGNVIVQYNTSRNIDVNTFAPFPFKLSRNRVSQENSFVKILDDKHPALNYPNKILLMILMDGCKKEDYISQIIGQKNIKQ